MAGPRSKRKRSEVAAAPAPRKARRDAADQPEDPEVPTATTTVEPREPASGPQIPARRAAEVGESSIADDGAHPPLQEQINSDGETVSAESAGASNLLGLLSHRKLLLRRVRQGRHAAKNRLELVLEQDPSRKDEDVEQEVSRYKELARVATSLARKQQSLSDAAASEKRATSLSLRRGSGVGKRMNAALSTLSGSIGASSSLYPASDVRHQAQMSLQRSVQVDGAVGALDAASVFGDSARSAKLTIASTSGAVAITPHSTSTVGRSLKKETSQRSTTEQQSPSANEGTRLSGEKSFGQPEAGTGANKANSISVRKGVGIQAAAEQAGKSYRMSQEQSKRPSVFCPETAALRERKRMLEGKLAQVFRKRHESSFSTSSSSQVSSVSTPLTPSSGVMMASPLGVPHGRASSQLGRPPSTKDTPPNLLQAAMRGPRSPYSVQSGSSISRRKTHWDYVLEEMRWLATDFVEERKWKTCAARSVSTAVLLERNQISAPSAKAVSMVETMSSDGAHRETSGDRRSESGESVSGSVPIGANGERGNELYTDPSSDDDARAKMVASILSSMITELSVSLPTLVVDDAGTREELVRALERHCRTRTRVSVEKEGPITEPSRDEETIHARESKVDVSLDHNAASEKSNEERDVSMRDTKMQRISNFVDGVVSAVNLNDKNESLNRPSDDIPVEATSDQATAMTNVEDCWLRLSTGAILGGPIHSGKTVVACSLLWKFRLDGPQLILCSPSSVIRWMHELGRFDGLVLRPLSVDAGISSPRPRNEEEARYTACDVVLCEHATFATLSADDVKPFHTIIVDGRYPNGFFGSRELLYEASLSGDDVQLIEPPDDLRSPGWWSQVSGHLQDSPRRLLIESSTPSQSLCLFQRLQDRQLLEVLALRLSLLFGARVFRMTGLSLAKSVLHWARRRVRKTDQQVSKLERVKALLIGLSDILAFKIEHANRLDDASGASSPKWELCLCGMPPQQRDAYERACRESRSALSGALGGRQGTRRDDDQFAIVSQSLFRLRQICIHPGARLLVSNSRSSNALNGPSQPDVQTALQVLENAGKLQELLALLVYDCGLVFEGLEVLEPLLRKSSTAKLMFANRKADRCIRRIAILASLTEAQLAVTLILNLLGVKHEALTAAASSDASSDAFRAVSWARHQVSLSRFNDESCEQRKDHQEIMIVVSSIEAVAGDHCGLGVELADVVICLDEDWSGRSELQMKSLVARSMARLGSGSCRFVRLAADESCEQAFLSTAQAANCPGSQATDKVSCPWPASRFGDLVPKWPRDDSRSLLEYWSKLSPGMNYFAFPSLNIASLRGRKLTTVLAAAETLPPLLSMQGEMTFLPFENDRTESCVTEVELSSSLVSLEPNRFLCVDSLRNVGRLDLAVLPSRLYLLNVRLKCSSEHSQGGAVGTPESEFTCVADLRHDAVHSVGAFDVDESAVTTFNSDAALSSLLFYSRNPVPCSAMPRINAYSSSFSTSDLTGVSIDGNSGREALVYFPPLFPRLLDCYEAAQPEISSKLDQLQLDAISKKRRTESHPSLLQQKRRRLDSDSFTDLLGFCDTDASMDFEVEKLSEKNPVESGLITEDEASQNDAASILHDLSDDFGVVGIGAIATPQESAVAAGATSAFPFLGLSIDWWSGNMSADFEETEGISKGATDAIVLFVSRKMPRGHASYSNHSVSPFQRPRSSAWELGITSSSRSFADSETLSNVNGAQKKLKRKLPNQGQIVSAFIRLPGSEPAHPERPSGQAISPSLKSRDIYRSRLLMTLRQTSSSRTLFAAPSFRAASSRVRQRISSRVGHLSWTSSSSLDSGSGLPILPAKHHLPVQSFTGSFRGTPIFWTSIVKRLRNKAASTGDEAIELADAQALAFHQSPVSPCRVDFGPFQAGFQGSVSGMTSALPIRPRPGVSLPMGVKLPPHREPLPPWSEEDKCALRFAVEQFGKNWILVSRFLCGYHDIGSFLSLSRIPRSPRGCRDQWQTMSWDQREASTQLKPPQEADAGFRQDATPSEVATTVTGIHGRALTFLVPTRLARLEGFSPGAEMDRAAALETESPNGRMFDRIMAAKAKTEAVSMQIPGMSSDGSPPAIVPSHPSHMQAVQTSAASSWSNGRTEMWPLQLLDAVDRYKNTLSSSAGGSGASSSAPHHALHSSSRSSSASNPNARPNGGARAALPGPGSVASSSSAPYVRGQHQRLVPASSSVGGPIAPHPPALPLRPQSFVIPLPNQRVPFPQNPAGASLGAAPLPHPPPDRGSHPSAPPAARDPEAASNGPL